MKNIISFDFDGVCDTKLKILINNLDLKKVIPIIISSRDYNEDNFKEVKQTIGIIKDKDIHLCGGFFGKLKKIEEIHPIIHYDDSKRVCTFLKLNTNISYCLIKTD